MTQLSTHTDSTVLEFAAADAARTRGRDWQRFALFAGGIAFAVGNMLHPLEHNDAAYTRPTWEAAHLTIFFSIPLLVLGLPVLYRRLQAERPRSPLNTFGVAASVVGLIGIAPGTILEAFVAPTIGYDAMTDLESGGMAIVNAAMGIAYLGGAIALGWAVRNARLRPRWTGPTLIMSSALLLGVMSGSGKVVGVIIISATAAYGFALCALAATIERPAAIRA
jgi:hypothetical protein